MIPLIKWEFKQRRLSSIFWALGTSFYVLLVDSVFKSFVNSQTVNFARTVQNLPSTVKSFISVTDSFNTPAGFLSSEPYYVVLPIIFIVMAISLGGSLLASEESSGTLELILSRPVSRGRLLAGKALSGLGLLLAVDIAAAAAMTLFTTLFRIHIAIKLIWEMHLMLLLLALVFGSLAFAITAVGRAGRSAALGITMLLAIGGYVLTSLEGAIHWLVWPAKLLPYHYYQPSQILNGTFTVWPAICFSVITIALIILAFISFRRRDLAGS